MKTIIPKYANESSETKKVYEPEWHMDEQWCIQLISKQISQKIQILDQKYDHIIEETKRKHHIELQEIIKQKKEESKNIVLNTVSTIPTTTGAIETAIHLFWNIYNTVTKSTNSFILVL